MIGKNWEELLVLKEPVLVDTQAGVIVFFSIEPKVHGPRKTTIEPAAHPLMGVLAWPGRPVHTSSRKRRNPGRRDVVQQPPQLILPELQYGQVVGLHGGNTGR